MFFVLVIYFTTVFASSHEKYIDLLPEEEKQEFLDRVARRILETVQQKVPKNSSSVVLSDEHLQEHNDFVNSILKEESERMKRSKEEQVNEKDGQGNLEVKPLSTVKIEATDKIKVSERVPIDFTINEARRRNSNESITTDSIRDVTEDVIENVSPMHTRSMRTDDESSKLQEKHTVIRKEQKYATLDDSIQTSESPLHSLSFFGSTTESQNWDSEQYDYSTSSTRKNKIDYNSLENTTLGDKPRNDLEYEISKFKENINTLETWKPVDISTTEINVMKGQVMKYTDDESKYKLTNNKSKNNSEIQDDDYLENHSLGISPNEKINLARSYVTSRLNLAKSKSYSDAEGSREGGKDHNTLSDTLSDERTSGITQATAHDVITVHSILLNVSEHQQKNNTNIDIGNITSVLSPKSAKKKTIKKAEKRHPKTVKEYKNIELSNKFVNEALEEVKARREKYNNVEYLQKKLQDEILKKDKECKGDQCKHYRVYEIQSPNRNDNLSFLRSQSVDQAYFIPVYDYSPNKAYYNPENRYGPNFIEKSSIGLDTEALRVGGTNNINIPNVRDLPEFQFINLDDEVDTFSIYHKKRNNAIYRHGYIRGKNSNNYKTPLKIPKKHIYKSLPREHVENYTNGYSVHIPDSHEFQHYNNMNKDLKTNIKAIRDILYYNRLFDNVPRKTKDDYIKYIHNTHIARDERKADLVRSENDKSKLRNYYFDERKEKKIKKSLNQIKILDITNDINVALKKFYRVLFSEMSEKYQSPLKNIQVIQKNNAKAVDAISKLIEATNEKDMLINLEKMKEDDMSGMTKNINIQTDIYMKTLKKLIVEDSNALKQYDWLGTTVQIQSALQKLKILIKRLQESKPIHPSDIEMLNYLAFLENFASQILEVNYYTNKLRKKYILPKIRKKNRKIINDKGLLNRVWLYLRTHLPDLTAEEQITKLKSFIMDIEDGLHDLHEALKNIAIITKFRNQNWYGNLKELYLNTEEKTLRELLLHLSVSRLISLIENSCENGLEEDFVKYMKNHRVESKRTLEETIFVFRIIEEINKDLV